MPNANYTHMVTLYNCLKASDSPDKKDHWYRHVLHDCYYKSAVARVDSGTSVGQQNVYTVRIPQSDKFRPYAKWRNLPDEDREYFFTMQLDDVVISGECVEEITGASGQTAAQVVKRYKPDAFKVTAVSDNSKAVFGKHYRLGG